MEMFSVLLGIVLVFGTVAGVSSAIGHLTDWPVRFVPVKEREQMPGVAGTATPFRITLKPGMPEHKRESILIHEESHVQDYWKLGLFGFQLWQLFQEEKATMWMESRAMAAEVLAGGRSYENAVASLMSPIYGLGINELQAQRAIDRWLP